jgi:hypothetical protein
MKSILLLLSSSLLLLSPWSSFAQEPSEAVMQGGGQESYVTFLPGNMPLIISIPHGGYLMPDEIPERPCVNCAKNQDIYTLEIGMGMRDAIYRMTGHYPHVIINNLHRTRLDPNRNIEEAADGNPDAEKAWNRFQGYIDSASALVTGEFGKGLFIDLHGHRHLIRRTELGYLLSGDELQFDDEMLDLGTFTEYSSIRNLASTSRGVISFSRLLRGPSSLGSMLGDLGYPTVPSAEIPFPSAGEPYFSGGYNTARHGSSAGGTIDGIQIELDLDLRSDLSRRDRLVEDLSKVLLEFIRIHYFPDTGITRSVDAM